MQLTELQTFLAIVESGSLVRASERLNVTQSTVTARLKSLEGELGQTLINRQKSGASLTAAGVRLQRYATTISELWRQARQETALPDGMSSVCNLGCHPDLWQHCGERVFESMRREFPAVALSVSVGNRTELTTWLNQGRIDLSLTYWPNINQNQDVRPLFEDTLVLVSSDKNSPIKFDPDYVFVEAGNEFEREHAASYADADTATISFNTARMGLEHITRHGGSAYLPQRIVTPYIETGTLHVLLDAPRFKRAAFVAFNKSAMKTSPWFAECLKMASA